LASRHVGYLSQGHEYILAPEKGELSVLSKTLNDKDAFLVFPVPKKEEPDEPVISNNVKKNIENGTKVGVGVTIGIGVYETAKWGVAAFLAPETFGGSLAGAAAIP
jgi:hypothetical protein